MSRRLRDEDGQAFLVTVLFLAVLMGCVAMVLDVGSWYRQQRAAQAAADSAALAGAQALPTDPSKASSLALTYAGSNGGGIAAANVSFRTDYETNDTIVVHDSRSAPGFFSRVFSVAGVTVGATAAARAGVPQQVDGAAPIVVNKAHPDLSGPGCPCFNTETTLPLGKNGAPGSFGLVDLLNSNGNEGTSTLAGWIQNGFNAYLPLGSYDSDPGAKFNGNIESALSARIGTTLLFPVYDSLDGEGSNAQYDVIGWVAFHLDSFSASGGNGSLTGYFTRVIWDGIQSNTNKHIPDFGTYSVALVN